MTREQLAHLLRAASRIAGDPEVLVIGSQAILGTFSEEQLPAEAWVSIEADLAFLDDSDGNKALLVDGAIGELSSFHELNSYYSQGVDVSVAVLPIGWRDRLVPFRPKAALPAQAWCLDPHDLAISKLAAARHKDIVFAQELLRARLLNRETLQIRTNQLPDENARQRRWILDWLARWDSDPQTAQN